MKFIVALLMILTVFACNDEQEVSDVLQEMQKIESQIDALVQLDCVASSQCIATPIGVKACGGPTHYIIHNSSTDMDMLTGLIERYNALNRTYNELTGAISDCAVVGPPALTCNSGICMEEQ